MKLNLRWLFLDLKNQLWFTVALYCLSGVAAALGALLLDPFIPDNISTRVGSEAVDRLLGILAASMLAVTTFSITTMVQAFASAASGATPRAAQLIVEDRTAHRALATFIGSFVFSLVGLIALSTGSYGASGRLVVFAATILVVLLIVVMLLRWISRLSRLGRVGETIDQVEAAAQAALLDRRRSPFLGASPQIALPVTVRAIFSPRVGYVRRIDVPRLAEIAEEADCDIHVRTVPGAFVTRDRPLVLVAGLPDDAFAEKMRSCFLIGDQRSFDQDPRFGMIVLCEIGSRALSPAINDSGTAIDVIGTMVRVLSVWAAEKPRDKPLCHRVFIPGISARDLVQDAFAPLARDGAGVVQVAIRLQKALLALQRIGDAELAEAAREQSLEALARMQEALTFAPDRERVEAVVAASPLR